MFLLLFLQCYAIFAQYYLSHTLVQCEVVQFISSIDSIILKQHCVNC